MRKFIVKQYALYYRIKVAGRVFSALRCTRIMFPYFFIGGCIIAADPSNTLQWFDWTIITVFLVQVWITGLIPFVPHYFKLYPLQWAELDEEQRFDYGSIMIATGREFTDAQYKEWLAITKKYQK